MIRGNDNNRCFVCGPANPNGLQIEFKFDEKTRFAEADIVYPEFYQGWEDVVHGGLIATLLDEVMVKAAFFEGYKCVTAELTVKYKKPVKTASAYSLSGNISEIRSKIITTEGRITDRHDVTLASATARLFILP